MPVTTAQLAKDMGLSRQTVSYALNDRKGLVSAAVRKRVLAAAARKGYRPNTAANAMRSGRFGTISLLLSTNAYRSNLPAPLLDGIHDALGQHDLHLMVARLPDEQLTAEGFVPRILREYASDGLLINYTDHIPGAMLDLIRTCRVPSIWINTKLDADCIHPDDEGAAFEATTLLIQRGHRRIAYLQAGDWGGHYSTSDRTAGYRRAIQNARLEPLVMGNLDRRPLPADELDQARASLHQQMRDLFARHRVDAAVCYSATEAAAAAMAWAACDDRPTPGTLPIVTFHDTSLASQGLPVHTLQLPLRELGVAAVNMLNNKIADPATAFPCRTVAYPPTTCPPIASVFRP